MKIQPDLAVRAALKLLKDNGLAAVSTRKVAAELGVQSPALYWHFPSKRALFDAMAETIMAEEHRQAVPAAGDDWRTWLAENARSFRRALLAYPDGALLHAGTTPGATQFPAVEAQAKLLVDAGLPATESLRTLISIGRYVVGCVLEEQAEFRDARERTGVQGVATERPALDDYPVLNAGREVFVPNPDADFEFGLSLILAGIATRLREGNIERDSNMTPAE